MPCDYVMMIKKYYPKSMCVVNKIKIFVDVIEAFSIKKCNNFFLKIRSLLQVFDNLEHRLQDVQINPLRIRIKIRKNFIRLIFFYNIRYLAYYIFNS